MLTIVGDIGSQYDASQKAPRERRGLARSWVCSWASAILPGTGQLIAGDRRIGAAIVALWIGGAGVIAWWAINQGQWEIARLAVQPSKLELLFAGIVIVAVLHITVIGHAWWRSRPGRNSGWPRWTAAAALLLVAWAFVAAPWTIAGRSVLAQRSLLLETFPSTGTTPAPTSPAYSVSIASGSGTNFMPDPAVYGATPTPTVPPATPTPIPEPEPRPSVWPEHGRINVLLLGSDAGPGRWGARMDTLVVVSIDTETGDTALFSLPRNLQGVPFREGTALAAAYPRGFPDLINAVYTMGEARPDLVGHAEFPGVFATIAAVEGLLGLPIDHFAMVDMAGFVEVVDILGGVTIDVTRRVPIGGLERPGQSLPATLEPGRQQLDGATALAYVRSRTGSSDYSRMQRQRCVLGALAAQTEPLELILRLPRLAQQIKSTVATDIPLDLLPHLVDLFARVDLAHVRAVAFTPPAFSTVRPDLDSVRSAVDAAMDGEADLTLTHVEELHEACAPD